MTTWIFQYNPSIFNLDAYLKLTPGAITWLVEQSVEDIRCGDTVFIWRSKGNGKNLSPSGVVAFAEVISDISLMSEEAKSLPFWIEKENIGTEQRRVWLKITRVANSKEELKRDWLINDVGLKGLRLLQQPAGINFKLTPDEGDRIRKMWSRVGQKWTRSESIAGMWAYVETYGKAVSELPNSPVGRVSQLTGRAASGVYNKVMNFRSIDDRDTRDGMSGAGKGDHAVWREFFDSETKILNERAFRDEFDRLWGVRPNDVIDTFADDHAESEVFGTEVGKLLSHSLESLLAAYNKQRQQSKVRTSDKPKTRTGRTTLYERNPLVVAIAKMRAASTCEVEACAHTLFLDATGEAYCEVHHIIPLSEGGADDIENVVCLCPAHHREAHFGKNSQVLRSAFYETRTQ